MSPSPSSRPAPLKGRSDLEDLGPRHVVDAKIPFPEGAGGFGDLQRGGVGTVAAPWGFLGALRRRDFGTDLPSPRARRRAEQSGSFLTCFEAPPPAWICSDPAPEMSSVPREPWLLPVPFTARPLRPPAPPACRAWLVLELCCLGQDLLPPADDAGKDLGIPQPQGGGSPTRRERAWKVLAPAGCCNSRLLASAQVFPSVCELNPASVLVGVVGVGSTSPETAGKPREREDLSGAKTFLVAFPRSHRVPQGWRPQLSLELCMP